MDCWEVVLAASYHRQSSELRVHTDPSASEKLIEEVVLLSVSIQEA